VSPIAYWIESVAASLDEHGIVATPEQVASIAADMKVSSESMDQAFGQPSNPLISDVDDLKKKLAAEKDKRGCATCKGTGVEEQSVGFRCSIGPCTKCNGEGKVPR